jgi:hypothetical protein
MGHKTGPKFLLPNFRLAAELSLEVLDVNQCGVVPGTSELELLRNQPTSRREAMKKLAALAAVGLLTASLAITIDASADDQPTIKVALTDLSASAGMGPMGQMMMGSGGQGMMAPGYGWGEGMMAPGYGGRQRMLTPGYGWRHGMMGPNMMMGMMAIRIDHDTVKAGPVKFDVTNWSRMILHEMLIVAVDPNAAPLRLQSGDSERGTGEGIRRHLGAATQCVPHA